MFQKIRDLKTEGLSQAEIARRLELDPKTVARYVSLNTPPKYKAREKSTRADSFHGFSEKVKSWITRTPALTDREIYELLLPEGYKGCERTINRRMKSLREVKSEERFFEQEYRPGEQAQFDFKEKVELPFFDGPRIVQLHFGTLPFSDACFVRGYPFKNYECFIDGVHEFFESLGGMTLNIRFDNLSPCVKKVLKGSERLYTDDFKRATSYYGFGLLPCRPATGSDKGDVERDIRTYAARIRNRVSHDVVVFKGFDHLNEWLSNFMQTRLSSNVSVRLDEEKKHLKTLLKKDEDVLSKVTVQTPSPHGSIRMGKSSYSVPDLWIGRDCRVVVGPYHVEIGLNGENALREKHERQADGEHSLLLKHVLPSLVRKPQAMVRWAHREILFPSKVCEQFYARLKSIESHGAEREYLRSMNLVLHLPLSEIIAGMELVLEGGRKNLFEELRDLLLGERRPENVIDIGLRHGMTPLKIELSNYDELIPKGLKHK
jgi:transposase